MIKIYSDVTTDYNIFEGKDPIELVEKYGSPLYVYNERIFRDKCREMKSLLKYPNFSVSYSAKANSNLTLLSIAQEEGLNVDAMSPGEIYVQQKAGFKPEQIFYISNNVSAEEMKYAIDNDVLISIDSISQLELFGSINRGGRVAVRFNPGHGAGHNAKVVTAGKNTKFGVEAKYLPQVKEIIKKYDLNLVGINQHIGSLFLEGTAYIESLKSLLSIAENFKDLEFIDMGGGFGIPYHKQEGQERLDLKKLGKEIDTIIFEWVKKYGREIHFKIEPGRYIPAECSVLLGTVHAVKENYGRKYAGTDLGFNVLIRPVMYDSHHDVEIYRKVDLKSDIKENVTIVGNICETGDILAYERLLPQIFEGDVLGILDAGAYGYVMSSNYNNRLRPAELLIKEDGTEKIIRRRDTLEDLIRNYEL
ncbi:diaminopimelate decarboxylase [Oxobacter pfennigii]|uniref:Diaminopimelate decarboxylase n=1 Tax=Oxobacter pfennigii TaxID=36849 RepID=A0A0P8WAT8_9CLOT|nr:diaminopimelate decarboxylase [Oxobacter pfennigii]KPU45743.1 diaminopimelate decarboxylase [Oxobacter pfennigii]